MLKRLIFLLTLSGALSACGQTSSPNQPSADPSHPNSVSDTLTAPLGSNVSHILVLACPIAGDCEAAGNAVQIEIKGSSAAFEIADLTSAPHNVFAWQDANGSGEMDEDDLIGAYTLDGENAASVTPPASGIEIRLEPTQSSPAEDVPTELLGDWQDSGYVAHRNFDLYESATGYWLNEYEDQGGAA